MIDINLLPYQKRTPKAFKYMILLFAAASLAVLGFFIWYSWQLTAQLQQARQQESVWQSRSETIGSESSQARSSAARALDELMSNRTSLYQNITKIYTQLPRGGAIQMLSYDSSDQMTIQCSLRSFADIKSFTDRLRANGFDPVSTEQVSRAGNHFDVSISLTISKKEQS